MRIVVSVVVLGVLSSVPASAQNAQIRIPWAGDCEVVVTVPGLRDVDLLELESTDRRRSITVVRRSTSGATLQFTPLQAGQTLRLSVNGAEVASAAVVALPSGEKPRGQCSGTRRRAKESSFDASVYLGTAIDTFAPDEVGNYKNPNGESEQKLREVFGVNFDARLWGSDDSPRQFWVAGETLHGVKSADIDCEKDPAPVCNSSDAQFTDRAKYILKHADSLEAFISPRLEFASVQADTNTPAVLYATARFGFIALERAPHVFSTMHVGLGWLAYDGPFSGSYFEVGVGKNELFAGSKFNRLKIDGLLSAGLSTLPLVKLIPGLDNANARAFIQMYIDNDVRGNLPDSVQTFFGIDFVLGED